jgi:hypothetical protein
MPAYRIHSKVISGLLIAWFCGSLASTAVGQSHLSNPRFRRRVEKPDRPPRPPRTRWSESRNVAPDTASAVDSDTGADDRNRARQALWHAQGTQERQAASAHGTVAMTKASGYRPKHERIARARLARRPDSAQNVATGYSDYGMEFVREEPGWSDAGMDPYDGAVFEGDSFVEEEGVWEGDIGYEFEDSFCDCAGGCLNCLHRRPPGAAYFMGDLTLFSGVQGFTNALNEGASGSFGYHQGFNLGTALPLFPCSGWGFQIGLRATQTNRSGTAQTSSRRNQTFFTTGVFKRSDWGWQGGLVVDVLRDKWVEDVNLTQLRGEISWNHGNRYDVGYWFAASGDTDTTSRGLLNPLQVSVSDVQGFFYRRRFSSIPGATYRCMIGFNNSSDTLFASEALLPLSNWFSMSTSSTYLIPNESRGAAGAQREVWNVGLSVVFSFRGHEARCTAPFAPLFRVADNGSFFVHPN